MAIRDCLGPRPARTPRWVPPPGAWDTHFHVLGPQARWPYAAERKYTPPDAPLAEALRLHEALGIARGLVVHANTHGFDNDVDLDAVARSNGRYFAVVRLDARATRAGCESLHAQGVRGVRFAFNPQHGGALDRAVFDHVLRCVEGLGWFIELHFQAEALPGLRAWLESLSVTLVIDHFARVDPSHGVQGESFGMLCALMRRSNVWVKLSGADRITHTDAPYEDVAPLARRLAAIAPERLLWGSDWPHTGVFDATRMPCDAGLLDAVPAWFPERAMQERLLVTNPLRLLGLGA